MEILLTGILVNPNIQSIEIVKNEVKSQSINKLIKLFAKGRKQITVLKLVDTKSSIDDAETLFKTLSKYSYLKELKLNNFKISERAANFLAETINNNMFLKKIDIGWNTMMHPTDFLKMMNIIKDNAYLVEASFSNTPCSTS